MPDDDGLARLRHRAASRRAGVRLRAGGFVEVDRYDGHTAAGSGVGLRGLPARARLCERRPVERVRDRRGRRRPHRLRLAHAQCAPAVARGRGALRDRVHDGRRARLDPRAGRRAVGAASVVREAALAVPGAGAVPRDVPRRATPVRSCTVRRTAPPTSTRCCARIARHDECESFGREDVARHVRPAYMGLVAQVDAHVGRLVRDARRPTGRLARHARSCSRPTTASSWATAGLGEKELFYDEVVRVPFIVVDPDARADATRGTPRGALRRGRRRRADDSSTRWASRRRIPLRGPLAAAAAARQAPVADWRDGVYVRARLQLPPRARRARPPRRRSAGRAMVRTAEWKYVALAGVPAAALRPRRAIRWSSSTSARRRPTATASAPTCTRGFSTGSPRAGIARR